MTQTNATGIDRRAFLKNGLALGTASSVSPLAQLASKVSAAENDREYWVRVATRVAHPVLEALSERRLKVAMPVEAPHGNVEDRRQYTYLEATGRLLCGMAPWFELGEESGSEGALRQQYAELARKAISAATDPHSPDFMNFTQGQQPVVDTAFLALAILRAPNELWHKLDAATQQHVIAALQSTRVILPGYNNWLMFSATIEAALAFMGAWWDHMRIDYAIRTMDSWYKGDGVYGDGPAFHCDYYNSFVIQPMLLIVLDAVSPLVSTWKSIQPEILARAQRYAAIQERSISPEATYPPIGRSLCYRFGAFHLLADISLRRQLPEDISPEQVRCALTAVMRRMIEAPGTFDQLGWLKVGLYGHQPTLAESYISTGSLYLCSAAWLPLGLPATDFFWTAEAKPWTAKKVWNGHDVDADHSLR